MNEFEQQLAQRLQVITSRNDQRELSAEDQALHTAFRLWGQTLDAAAANEFPQHGLLNDVERVAPRNEGAPFAWREMLLLAASLLLLASFAAWQVSRSARGFQHAVAVTPSVPVHQAAWEDDWDTRYEHMQSSLSAARLSRLDATDSAAWWLNATLQEVAGEVMADSM